MDYFKKYSPIYAENEGRIRFSVDEITSGSATLSALTLNTALLLYYFI